MSHLETIKRPEGMKGKGKRLGRGPGTGLGKTAGRGHKGQKSRSGGSTKPWFEGGQMPLQRRLPKRGFHSRITKTMAEIRLHELSGVEGDIVDLAALHKAGLVGGAILRAKVIASGTIDRAVTLVGIGATKGARAEIEKAGGKVEA